MVNMVLIGGGLIKGSSWVREYPDAWHHVMNRGRRGKRFEEIEKNPIIIVKLLVAVSFMLPFLFFVLPISISDPFFMVVVNHLGGGYSDHPQQPFRHFDRFIYFLLHIF